MYPKRHNFAANFCFLGQIIAISFKQRNLDVCLRLAVKHFHVMNKFFAFYDRLKFNDVTTFARIL